MPKTTRKNPRILKRNELIREEFKELNEKQHLKIPRVLELLEKKYITLNKTTLWLIVSQTGHYKNY